MKKFYYLSSCDTCKRILKELDLPREVALIDIKKTPVSADDLDELYRRSGSYESLFNKRSQLYKKLGLKDRNLGEDDFRHYILEHYTFLKRPVLVLDDHIFAGNSKRTVEEAKKMLHS